MKRGKILSVNAGCDHPAPGELSYVAYPGWRWKNSLLTTLNSLANVR